jgi:ribosomal-protein-alanine N-acetyltransferase
MTEQQTIAPTAYHVRWMIRIDMPEVMAIDAAASPAPWSEEDFLAALRQRNCIGMVAEQGDKVVGFMVYELHNRKLELLRLAVAQGSNAGLALVEKLRSKLSAHRRQWVGANVRESDVHLQLLLSQDGSAFQAVRVERSHFEDTGEDAYRMVLRLPPCQDD